jgi:hypothetical protein
VRASALLLAVGGMTAATGHGAGAGTPLPAGCTAVKTVVTCEFDYTGNAVPFIVPPNIRAVTINAWGAQGGGLQNLGGKGGHDGGTVAVNPGDALAVLVGGTPPAVATSGGFNGGGLSVYPGNPLGGPGGGASDVRRAPGALDNRIVVAGGGGGAGFAVFGGSTTDAIGGGAGDAAAVSSDPVCTDPGPQNICGVPGALFAGGAAGDISGCHNVLASPAIGTFGNGGQGVACDVQNGSLDATEPGGGGGGGYFGGGGGGAGPSGESDVAFFGGGGGGSGFVDDNAVNVVHEAGVQSGNGKVTISYNTKPLPLAGTIDCPVLATLTFKPAIHTMISTKPVKVSITAIPGGDCDTRRVVGGKAPILSASVKTTVLYSQLGCNGGPLATKQSMKTQVKFLGLNAKGKTFTVGTYNTTWNSFSFAFFDMPLNAPVKTTGPFGNDTGLFSLVHDVSLTTGPCVSPEGLGTLQTSGDILVQS